MVLLRAKGWLAVFLSLLALLKSTDLSAQEQKDALRLRCEAYCSRDKLRTAKARIFWVGPQMPLGPKAFQSRAAQVSETVEATVYKKGFDQNLYTSLDARSGTAPGAAFRSQAKQPQPLPGLDLKVTEFARPSLTTRQRRAFGQPEALKSPAPAAVAAQETSVEVEGLEPGLKYQWRVRLKGPGGEQLTGVAICIAPTCPADLRE